MNIVVIGATGMIGKPVTHELLRAKLSVTVLARTPQKAHNLFPGVRIVQGDVFDTASLIAAFQNQDAVYISLGPSRNARISDKLTEREGIDNIISAAKHTGIKRILLLSSLVQRYNHTNGFAWWVFDVKANAANKISSSGIPYTIFYPSTFMECFDQLLKVGNLLLLAGKSREPMYFIAGSDYGKQVAKAISLNDAMNQEYVIQGPAAYNWHEAASIFSAHYQFGNLKIMQLPMFPLRWMGMINATADYGVRITDALNKYPESFEAQNTWRELGKPNITLEEYAQSLSY